MAVRGVLFLRLSLWGKLEGMSKQLSILVVDDDVDNAMSLGELFELEGHSVSIVHNGRDAVDRYIAQNFDIAFMDVMMPGMNGVESFLEIRRLKPQARVFMMTGYSVEELLHQAVRHGAMGVLEKPFEPSEILRLTDSVGPNGLVVATPEAVTVNAAESIAAAITSSGRGCKLVRHQSQLAGDFKNDEVVVLDTNDALIDSVSSFKNILARGHSAPTFIMPKQVPQVQLPSFQDVTITGILNKPFDPLELLNRLPQLAA
jgi:two-component system, NtrC family, response regulator HydG